MLIMFQKYISWLVVYFGLFFKEYDLLSRIRLFFRRFHFEFIL